MSQLESKKSDKQPTSDLFLKQLAILQIQNFPFKNINGKFKIFKIEKLFPSLFSFELGWLNFLLNYMREMH